MPRALAVHARAGYLACWLSTLALGCLARWLSTLALACLERWLSTLALACLARWLSTLALACLARAGCPRSSWLASLVLTGWEMGGSGHFGGNDVSYCQF